MPTPRTFDDAFTAYQRTDEYASVRSFALDPDNVDNALRIVFAAGCTAARDADQATNRKEPPHPSEFA